MTNQTRNVAWKNTYIAGEWGRNGKLSDNTEYTREEAQKRFRRKKASPGTKTRQQNTLKYEGRNNKCPDHNMQRAVATGLCPMCE